MVWRIINVPTKESGVDIECELIEGGYKICTSEGWEICLLTGTQDSIGRGIADAMEMVRDIGFEQGRKHVRDSLGIK